MAGNGDIEAITRALREVSHVADGVIVKLLKGILERQGRIFARLAATEDQIEALRKSNALAAL